MIIIHYTYMHTHNTHVVGVFELCDLLAILFTLCFLKQDGLLRIKPGGIVFLSLQ